MNSDDDTLMVDLKNGTQLSFKMTDTSSVTISDNEISYYKGFDDGNYEIYTLTENKNNNNSWTVIKVQSTTDEVEEVTNDADIYNASGVKVSLNDIKKTMKNLQEQKSKSSQDNYNHGFGANEDYYGGAISKLTIAGKKFTAYVKYNGEFVTVKKAQTLANKQHKKQTKK